MNEVRKWSLMVNIETGIKIWDLSIENMLPKAKIISVVCQE